MGAWNHAFEQEAVSLVHRVVVKDTAAWRSLMVKVAPRLEGWARHNKLLKRCRYQDIQVGLGHAFLLPDPVARAVGGALLGTSNPELIL